MKSIRTVYAIARADFLERVRRNSYLVTLLFAVYMGYAAGTGQISLRLGDYRGLYTSAWIGIMVSLVTSTFLSLVGFYVVKNAVDRDRQTGVGQILAATPLTKNSYFLGKFLSNFAVLGSVVLVLALGAVAIQLFAAEDRTFHLWALLSPFLLLTLPAMGVTAALALVFESFSFLRAGLGNVIWFFVWSFGLGLPAITHLPQADPFGIWTAYESMAPAARAGIPGYVDGFSLTIADKAVKVASGFHWNGLEWTAGAITTRFAWVGVAFALVLLGALFFDRFDPAGSRAQAAAKKRHKGAVPSEAPAPESFSAQARTAAPVELTALTGGVKNSGALRILEAEILLALKGYRWWWYAVAGGLLVAQFTSPLDVARGPLLAAAWIWPILVWSTLGTREARFGTSQLIFSCARILPRQFPAVWMAGVVVTLLTGLGAGVRLALAGQHASLAAWAAGVLFIPSLALALGVWSGTSKFFEGLYVALWYVGPLNHAPGIDFTGSSSGTQTIRYAAIYFCLAAILVAAAFFRRGRQLRGT
jgi:hypothetical protein